MRALGIDPVSDTRDTFRALCRAMSRPGTVQEVPASPADYGVAATLVDHEVTFHTPDATLCEALAARGRYEAAEPSGADVLHARGTPDWDVREVSRGTLREPSDGATVIYRVDSLSADPDAPGGTTVELSGPGVPGSRRLGIDLPAAELDALADAGATYPRGVDAVFTTDESVAAIPRSASLEVV